MASSDHQQDFATTRWSLIAAIGESSQADKSELFEALKRYLGQGTTTPYRQVAESLGMSETAVKVAAHRMRKRCGQILREEIAHTLNDPTAVDAELQKLFTAVEL